MPQRLLGALLTLRHNSNCDEKRQTFGWTFSIKVRQSKAQLWTSAQAESLIEAGLSEDHELTIALLTVLLDQLSAFLTHSTFFGEKREELYNVQQKAAENTMTYFSRIMDQYRQAEFLDNTHFLIVDTLIHGFISKQCRRKLIAKGKDVFVKDCLEFMRKFEVIEVTVKKSEHSTDAQSAQQSSN